jgi:putative spermidine/putrescine transport system permease protein
VPRSTQTSKPDPGAVRYRVRDIALGHTLSGLFGVNMLFVALILLLPVIMIVWAAFVDSVFISFPAEGFTLRWVKAAIEYPAFRSGFIVSLQVALGTAIIGVLLGGAASLALVRGGFPGRNLLTVLLVSPLMVPNIVLGVALYLFFIWVTDFFATGLVSGVSGLILAHLLLTVPYSVRLISSTLVGVDRSVEESAASLGASPGVVFWRITLPQMRAGILAAAVFSFIISFENVELSLLLVGPGETTLPIALMQYLEFKMDPTVAAASMLQILVIGALLLITERFVTLGRVV